LTTAAWVVYKRLFLGGVNLAQERRGAKPVALRPSATRLQIVGAIAMRCLVLLIAISAFCGFSTSSFADNYGSYLIGDWEITGTVRGQQALGTFNAKPAAGGKCLLMQWEIKAGGKTSQGAGIGGSDPKTGKPVEYGFVNDGAHWTNTYDKDLGEKLGKLSGQREGIVNGQPIDAKVEVNRTAKNRFVYVVREGTGEPTAELVFEKKQ